MVRSSTERGPRLLSIRDAALRIGLPISTFRDLISRGHVPVVRPPDIRRVLVASDDVDRLIEAWRERVSA